MGHKFKVGDRVRVYGILRAGRVGFYQGNVTLVDEEAQAVEVATSTGTLVTAHPKQCRRLVPPKARACMWVKTPGPISAKSGRLEQIVHVPKSGPGDKPTDGEWTLFVAKKAK